MRGRRACMECHVIFRCVGGLLGEMHKGLKQSGIGRVNVDNDCEGKNLVGNRSPSRPLIVSCLVKFW